MPNTVQLTTRAIDVHANGHKQILTSFARALSPAVFYDYPTLSDKLIHLSGNETAAIGGGVMIFHGWIDDWKDQTTSFIRLHKPLEIQNTPDRVPVDLVLLLLSPKSDGPVHLSHLSHLTRMMRDDQFCSMLRGATSVDAVDALFDRMNRLKHVA